MQFKDLKKFIKKYDKELKRRYPNEGEVVRILARTVKLSEEVGELSDEILSYNNMQRNEKMDKKSKESAGDEFADVIITTLLLAESMNVDIEKVLDNKIKKIDKRDEKR